MEQNFTERLVEQRREQSDLPPSRDKINLLGTAMHSKYELNNVVANITGMNKYGHTEARIKSIDLAGDGENSIDKISKLMFKIPLGEAVKDGEAVAFYNNADKYARTNPDEWIGLKEALKASVMENKGDLSRASEVIQKELAKTGQSTWSAKILGRLAFDKRNNNLPSR